MRSALRNGTIAMHAFPFDAQPELLDADMFEYGLRLGAEIARDVGITKPTVLSQRDVPSMTRAVIPLLQAAGVCYGYTDVVISLNHRHATLFSSSLRSCLLQV